jgi:hypothetical protein
MLAAALAVIGAWVEPSFGNVGQRGYWVAVSVEHIELTPTPK